MRAHAVSLTAEEQIHLESPARRATSAARDVFRAKVILRAAGGASNEEIAEGLHTRTATVGKWRNRFLKDGLGGLRDAARSGKPAIYDKRSEKRILAQLDEPAPKAMPGGTEVYWLPR